MKMKEKVLLETKKKLEKEIDRLTVLAFKDPEHEAIKIETFEFAELLEKYTGKDRLTPEFQEKINELSRRADEWRAITKDPEIDYIHELVERQGEHTDIINQLWQFNRFENK